MKNKTFLAGLAALGLAFATVSSGAFAQQPQPQPPPGQPAPGQPAPGQPGQQPPSRQPPPRPIQVQPGQPGMQPGQPGQPGQPPRRAVPRPGPGAPGQLPAGHPPIPGAQPAGDAHGGGGKPAGGHCAGHGPNDPPPHINWYQGLLGVNNEKAQSPKFIDRLFWRYKNDKDECDHKNQEPPVLASFINFALLAFVLFRFGKTPVMTALAKRKKDITQDIDAANELKVDAEKRLKNYERQLSRIEERRKDLQEEARLQWEVEKKRILDEAQEKSERLRKDARFRVEQELKQAQADLMREAIDGSVAAAEALLKSRIQSADQERLADEYLTNVGASLKAAPKQAAEGKA